MVLTEIERKRALDTRSAQHLPERLRDLGFSTAGSTREVDTYYSRPDVDFLETVECLRVRRSPERCEITYKPASDHATHAPDGTVAKPETNVPLTGPDDEASAHRLLTALGMVRLAEVDKSRTSFRIPAEPELTVVVDTVASLGTFIETEVVSDRPRGRVLAQLDEIERLLGLRDLPIVSQPYRDLVLAQEKNERPSATTDA